MLADTRCDACLKPLHDHAHWCPYHVAPTMDEDPEPRRDIHAELKEPWQEP